MKLCTAMIQTEKLPAGQDRIFFGVVEGGKIFRPMLAALAAGHGMTELARFYRIENFFSDYEANLAALRTLLAASEDTGAVGRDGLPLWLPIEQVQFLQPIPRPGKVLCIGMNYRDHCEEQNKPIPEFPVVFNKFATSLLGHEATIPLPLASDTKIDYEAELAFVIGTRARNVRREEALRHVAGYTIMNDVSLRAVQKREPQWSRAKGWDGSGPCGPWIVTTDELPDPHALGVTCTVNGEVLQRSNTANLIFKVPDLIAFISELVTLEPGDIVSTGTPGGVGAYRTPPVFLKPGDTVEVTIESIGTLRNTCGERKK